MCIDRNFRNVKDRPYCPIRCCLKKTGPLDDALIAIAITRNKGAHTINASDAAGNIHQPLYAQ